MPECHWPSPSACPSWFTCRKWSLWALGWLQRRWRWKGVQRAKIWGLCREFSLFRPYSSSLCVTLQKFHNFVSFGQTSWAVLWEVAGVNKKLITVELGSWVLMRPKRKGDHIETAWRQLRQPSAKNQLYIASFFSSSFSLQAVWVLWISFARPWVLRQLAEHCMSEISGKLGMQGDRRRSYSRSWFERISHGLLCGIPFCVLLGHISAFVHREVVRSLSSTRPPGTAGKDSDRPRGRSCERSQLMGFHWFFIKATPFWPRGVAEWSFHCTQPLAASRPK